jgi:hypothetical protein
MTDREIPTRLSQKSDFYRVCAICMPHEWDFYDCLYPWEINLKKRIILYRKKTETVSSIEEGRAASKSPH